MTQETARTTHYTANKRRQFPALLIQAGLMIAVPLLLVIGSIRVVMTPLFLTFEYTRPGFPVDPYGFSTEDRLEYGPLGIEYLLNGESIAFLADQRLPGDLCYPPTVGENACPLFGERELQHMLDVKIVTQAAFAAGVIGLGLFLVGAGVMWPQSYGRYRLGQALSQGGKLTLASIATIIILAIAAWDVFFNAFHDLFFAPGTWRFFYSDTLIRLYPEQFWFDAAVTVGALTSLGAIVLWRLGSLLARFNKPIT